MKILALLLLFTIAPDARTGESLDAGIRLYSLGEFNQAVKTFSQARDALPDDPTVRLWLGKSHLKIREWDKAVREMEKAVQLQPSNANYHLWLGRAYGFKASNTIFFKALGWARRVVKEFETDGAFLFVGLTPRTGFLKGLVKMDESGYLITNDECATSVEGFFAAGDCRKRLLRQVATAVGDGATAAFAAEKYLEEKE